LFLGGYNLNLTLLLNLFKLLFDIFYSVYFVIADILLFLQITTSLLINVYIAPFSYGLLDTHYNIIDPNYENYFSDYFLYQKKIIEFFTASDKQNLIYSLILAVKTFVMIFTFI